MDGFDGEHLWSICRRRIVMAGYPYSDDGLYGHDGTGVILGHVNPRTGAWSPRPGESHLSHDDLLTMITIDGIPCVTEEWDVVVTGFPTREAAEAYGRLHPPDEGRSAWRAVPHRAAPWIVALALAHWRG
jgi:hypothetical protein